jgi:hypothetical protein
MWWRATAETRDPLTAIARSCMLVSGAVGTSPQPGGPPSAPPPRGGGGTAHRRPPSAVVPAPKAAAGCRERAGGPGFSCCRTRRRESHPPAVCATSKEAEARPGCIYPLRPWPGRAPVRCRRPGPLHPRKTQARRGRGALERRNPLKYFDIHPKIYTLRPGCIVHIFEPLLNPLPRTAARGRQPGPRGRTGLRFRSLPPTQSGLAGFG